MSQKLPSPHLLNASSNVRRMLTNLDHCLDAGALGALNTELDRQCKLLYQLGQAHFRFACQQSSYHWRQRVSRLYYGAYNCKRAVQLHVEGVFRMDIKDHKEVSKLPSDFPNSSTYEVRLRALREDRNLADYNHEARASDLAHGTSDTQCMVENFVSDARTYLRLRGLQL